MWVRPVIEDPAEVEASALDPAFLQGILDRHRAEAHSLLAAAADEWITDGCPRFNDHETSCTAVLVGFLADLIRKGRASAFQIAVSGDRRVDRGASGRAVRPGCGPAT